MKIKIKKILISVIILGFIGGIYGTVTLYKSQNPKALKFKKYVKYSITSTKISQIPEETVGLDGIKKIELYENNYLVARDTMNSSKDNKKIYITDDAKRIINYTSGYLFDLPKDTNFDFDYSPLYVKAKNDSFEVTVSRETSPYDEIDRYFDYYLNRFITNNQYQKENDITFIEKTNQNYNGNEMQIITVVLNNLDESKFDGYTYITIKTDTRIFFRMMFKYHSNDKGYKDILENALKSFKYFEPIGEPVYTVDYKPNPPQKWSEETKKLYKLIQNSDEIRWGIFAKDIYGNGINNLVPNIEKKIDYKFPVILSYIHFKTDFPMDFMKKNYNDGKIVELTYQITESNNENLFGYTPNLDVYRGKKDEEIRKFARSAKEFGHPFMFRLNNEMNSDWTSYSGVINLSDPEIYIENWRRFYKIFEEEGVDNVIWIFNPNDRNFPPCNWNNFLAYYPGNEYVQMIGVTGYNNGTYYAKENCEEWREFTQIYDEIQEKYDRFFSRFPWIITEFSSSSIGGDKEKWIENMFEQIEKYKNIKIAVWFSYADYDAHGNVARPYWLDETLETLEAFKKGVKTKGIEGWGK